MQEENRLSYAPIVMFVYNRADHFKQTFQALSACPEARNSELFIFSDGAKDKSGEAKVQEVRDALKFIQNKKLFYNYHIVESSFNKGLAGSVITGVTQVINRFGEVIVLEDDCVVSPYFLHYMNLALNTYREDKKIGSIAGYTPKLDFPPNYNEDVFLTYRSCSCGWATWKDRWETVDWNMEYMRQFYKNWDLVQKLNSCGSDRFLRLYRQTKGNGTSWSVCFGAQLVLNDQCTVYPRYSYISNIGCDASGVHSSKNDAESMHVDLNKAIAEPNLNLDHLELNPKIQNIMKKKYSFGAVSNLKRFLATSAILIKERTLG